ncbi:hypothetical protein ABVB72_02315 [Rhizobium nepotum]|uniref:hypothetical protein n=1 Tax=Rhizobium nepotum TaxID=1035271 RepID=UPI003369D757
MDEVERADQRAACFCAREKTTLKNQRVLDVIDLIGKIAGAGSGNRTRVFSLEGFQIVQ